MWNSYISYMSLIIWDSYISYICQYHHVKLIYIIYESHYVKLIYIIYESHNMRLIYFIYVSLIMLNSYISYMSLIIWDTYISYMSVSCGSCQFMRLIHLKRCLLVSFAVCRSLLMSVHETRVCQFGVQIDIVCSGIYEYEYCLFYRALLQKRPVVVRSLLIVATP